MKPPSQGTRDVPASIVPMVDDVEWYLGLDGVLDGPMEMEELARRLARCPPGADVLVWREGLPDWVEPGALPETADLYEERSLDRHAPSRARDVRDTSAPAGPQELEQFLEQSEARGRSRPTGPPLLQPLLHPDAAAFGELSKSPLAPAPAPAPSKAPRPPPAPVTTEGLRRAVLLPVAAVLVLLAGFGLLLKDQTDDPTLEEPPEPPPLPAVRATPPGQKAPAPALATKTPAPRPRHVTRRPSRPGRVPSKPAAAPGEEALPESKEAKRTWLVDVQEQIRGLRRKRGALLQKLSDKAQEPAALARTRSALWLMRYREVAAHKLRGRLLEDLARDAPPLPRPP